MRCKSYFVLSAAVLLSGTACFRTPVASTGDISARVKRTATAEVQSQAKAISAVDSNSKEDIQLTMASSSPLAGTSVTVQPGTLSISTSLVIEQGVDFADSSLNSEITLSEDISIKQAGQGTIIRPSEDAQLSKELQLSLPLPVLGMRLASVPYAVYYKYLDPSSKQLMTGVKAIDGTTVKISYDDARGGDVVQFGGYFGIYWIVVLNRPVTAAELPQAKVSSEPIINKNNAAVITSTGIVKETEVVAVQALPEVTWQKPTLAWDNSTRKVKVQTTASAVVNSCKGDFFESSSDLTGQVVDAESTSAAVYAVQKTIAHNLVGRLRCKDANGRSTLSAWSDALSIPAYVDPSGGTSAPVSGGSSTPSVPDTTAPTITQLSSTSADRAYGVGTSVSIAVSFSEVVTLDGAGATLKLETGTIDRDATYVSGSGSQVLLFQYSVQTGDTSADLDQQSTTAITLLSGATIKDAAGNNADLTISTAAGLAAHSAIVIDTTAPTAPSSVAFSGSTSSNPFAVSWTAGSDSNFSTHSIKLCTANDCATGCSSAGNFVSSPASVSGTNGTTVYACIKSLDTAGNASAYVASSGTMTIDNTAATVINTSSQTADGFYTTGNAINLLVQFSKPVVVTNGSSIGLLLETGATDRSALYLSGSGTDTLTFRYTVSAGDETADLTHQSTSALSLGGSGTIKDSAGNNADLTLPPIAGGNSIGGQSNIVIDTTPPTVGSLAEITSNASYPINATSSGATTFLWTKISGPGTVTFSSATSEDTSVTATADGSYVLRLTASDQAGNSASTDLSFVWDTTPPTFSGLFGLVKKFDGSSVWLYWKPASDTFSSSEEITYEICADAPGQCASSFVQNYPVAAGVYNYQITGLSGSTDYEFVVRARDKAGNRDTNVIAKSSASLADVIEVAAGDTHSCALINGGAVKCWGDNYFGQLGNGSFTGSGKPVAVSGITTAVSIAVSSAHSCAALANGNVKCWGDNSSSQLGDGGNTQQSTPVTVTGLTGATKVALSDTFTCAIVNGGEVKCWGDNANGQLGNNASGIETSPVSAQGISTAVAITTGMQHTCALLANNSVSCWGDNSDGQLGIGPNPTAFIPTAVSGLPAVSSLDAGGSTTCAVSSGNLYCWGYNGGGQFGDNSFVGSAIPTLISGLSSVSEVSVGQISTCVRVSGNLQCWGANIGGQLGIGNRSEQFIPVSLPIIATASNISVGYSHACALLTSGKVQCWGFDSNDQLGRNMLGLRGMPIIVADLGAENSYQIRDNHACLLTMSQTVSCRGLNNGGELGDGTKVASETFVYTGLGSIQYLATGLYHSCALHSDGSVECWGSNSDGQLGNGNLNDSQSPVSVTGITTASSIAVGSNFSCALLLDGAIKCWGSNIVGQLGDGTSSNQSTAVSVSGITTATMISLGDTHACARLADGSMKCWGYNGSGSIGDSTLTNRVAPVSPTGLSTNIASVWAGAGQSCAILNDGSVYCWGENTQGQLGDGSLIDRNSPNLITGLGSNVSSLALGPNHSCAVLSNGKALCWGQNDKGELGDGTFSASSSPVAVNGISGAQYASVSGVASCFGTSDGKVRCIGESRFGIFGPAMPEGWLASMSVTAP